MDLVRHSCRPRNVRLDHEHEQAGYQGDEQPWRNDESPTLYSYGGEDVPLTSQKGATYVMNVVLF